MPEDSRPSHGVICSDGGREGLVMDPRLLDHCSPGGNLRQKLSMKKTTMRETRMAMGMEVLATIVALARESNPLVYTRSVTSGGKAENPSVSNLDEKHWPTPQPLRDEGVVEQLGMKNGPGPRYYIFSTQWAINGRARDTLTENIKNSRAGDGLLP